MRTAVVRINVDPRAELEQSTLRERMEALSREAEKAGLELVSINLDTLPPNRRELQFLAATDDPTTVRATASTLCRRAFGVEPNAGAVTYLSRGTDDDAAGVLAGFGLTGTISRSLDDDGYDVVEVRLRRSDLARIPESRVQTALEAALNAEVRLLVEELQD
ncbi:hypothetical protein [Cryptosporangium sp. NPDC048952]|uniref:hypothetical protein n=1 Tax=Cryptosporangium sp. NPDC048952 TaxID=3363961 RepID=UPI0037223B1A